MKTWHWQRIKFYAAPEPKYAEAGNFVAVYVAVKNSDPRSPFRETHYALESLGL